MIGRRSLLLVARTVLSAAMNMLGTAVVARRMGAEALGTVGYLMGIVGMLSIASDLGYSVAYVRRIASRREIGRDIGTFAFIKCALALLLIVAIIAVPIVDRCFSKSLVHLDHVIPYLLVGVFYVTGILSSTFISTFVARLEAAKVAIAGLAGSFLLLTARILAAWHGWGVVGLSVAAAAEGIGILAMAAILFRGYKAGRPSRALMRDYTAYAWPQMTLIAITALTGGVDRAMLGRLSGAAQVGYYVSVLGVLAVTTEITRAMMSLFFPRVSRDADRADFAGMHNRVKGALKYLLLTIVPLVGAAILMRDWWVPFYLGADFGAAIPTAVVLALTSIPVAISRPYQHVLFAVKQQSHLLEVQIAGLLVLVASGALLIPQSLFGIPGAGLGAVGAGLAMLIKDTVECAYIILLSARYARIGFWKDTLWYFLAGMVLVMVGSAVIAQFPQPGILAALVAVAAGLAPYLLVLYTVRQLRKAEVTLLLDIIHPMKLLAYIRSELNTVGQEAPDYPDDVGSGPQ